MAEAFGIGTGVVGVISLAIQVAQTISQFALDWKDAPNDLKSFLCELQSLKTTLSEIHSNLLLNKDFAEAFQGRPSTLISQLNVRSPSSQDTVLTLEECRQDLENLLDELKSRTKKHHAALERLKWPLFAAQKTQKTVDKLHRHCQVFNSMVSIDSAVLGASTYKEIKEGRREQRIWHETEENQKILAWISRLSFEATHRDMLSKRHPGTGEWLLASEEFREWKDDLLNQSSILWCPGIPGAGKSVMTSFVINHLKTTSWNKRVSISYIYCDYKDRRNQTAVNLMSSLVKQLLLQHNDMPAEIKMSYSRNGNGNSTPSFDEYSELLQLTLNLFTTSFIMIDALDEHLELSKDTNSSARAIKFLKQVRDIQWRLAARRSCKLFITSRENRLIEEQLSGCARIDIRATDSDIREYLKSQILNDNTFPLAERLREDHNLTSNILENVVTKAHGMFLLPRLHIEHLASQSTLRKLRGAIANLPNGLDDTYDTAMARIEAQLPGYRELAIKILCWISHAARPLRVEELQHALAVEIGDQEFDDEGIEPENLLVSVCAGLVTVDDRSQTIRLVHYTVEEYFEKIKRNRFPNAQRDIARTLLTYLSFDVFGDKGCLSDKKSKDGVQQFALFDYATQYWAYHTADAQNDSVYKFAVDFLTHDFKAQNAGLALLARDRVVAAHNFLGIHLASYVGLKPLVSLLIAAGANPNSKDSLGRSPLSWAAMKGHVEVVKLLLAIPSIELDSKDMFDSTPIYLAAKYGHVEVVKEFLAIAKPMANDWDQGGEKQSSFSKDSRYDGVNDSLSTSAYHNPNSNSMYYSGEKPLSQAIRNGHFEIVKLLLGNEGIDRNRTSSLETPLLLAIKKGQPHIATMLLAAGADPNMGNRFLDTPLTCALDGGYMELVDTLLVAGARPNPEDFAFEGALNRAVRRQDVTVVKQACKGGITLLYKTSHRKSILHDTSTMEKSQ